MQSDIGSQAKGFFAFTDVGSLISNFVTFSIVVAAILMFLYLVMAGFSWMTGGDDKTKVEGAQKSITNAIIGLVVVASAFAIFQLVKTFLGLDQAIQTPGT